MKTAFVIVFALSLISLNQKAEKERWFLLSQVKFENTESCPNKKVNFILWLTSDKSINLNSVSYTKIKIDTICTFLISSGQDTLFLCKAIDFCDLLRPMEIKITYSGNCEDHTKMSVCYGGAFTQMLTTRETTAPEDTLIEYGDLDLASSENYITIDIKTVHDVDVREFHTIEE